MTPNWIILTLSSSFTNTTKYRPQALALLEKRPAALKRDPPKRRPTQVIQNHKPMGYHAALAGALKALPDTRSGAAWRIELCGVEQVRH